jgi:hypothetical protein
MNVEVQQDSAMSRGILLLKFPLFKFTSGCLQ